MHSIPDFLEGLDIQMSQRAFYTNSKVKWWIIGGDSTIWLNNWK